MADGPQTDYSQDKDFMAAPSSQQLSYLSHVDPDFAKASPDQQLAYLNSITGKPAPTSAAQVKNLEPKSILSSLSPSNLAKNAWTGVKQFGEGTWNFGKQVADPSVPVIGSTHWQNGKVEVDPSSLLGAVTAGLPEEQKKASELWQQPGVGPKFEAAGHELASYIPFIGPWAASLGEQAGTGDVGGAATRGGATVGALEGAKALIPSPETVGNWRGRAGEAIRTGEGKLKPGVRVASQLGGAAAGGAAGSLLRLPDEYGPLGGMYAGWKAGPQILESLFPDPNAELRARGAFMNRGYKPAEGSIIPTPRDADPFTGRGIRPSESERTATNLVRKPILSPEEYEQEQRLLGKKAALKPGEGTAGREARLLGTVRARRAARGMKEPQ